MKWFVIVVGVSYSLIRYAWAQDIPLENWPAFVGNKAMAFCAVSFLILGFWQRLKNKEQGKQFFYYSFIAAIAHGTMSMALLSPNYYQFLFGEGGKHNVFGEMTLFFGALAFAFFLATTRESNSFQKDMCILFVILSHVISVGVLKWINPVRWSYGLVPISLISCFIIMSGIVVRLKQKKFQDLQIEKKV